MKVARGRTQIADSSHGAKPAVKLIVGQEFAATVEDEAAAGRAGQGSERLDHSVEEREGLPVIVAQRHRETAFALHQ